MCLVSPGPAERIAALVEEVRRALDKHKRQCGNRVVGIALDPEAHEELAIAEFWGLPVLAWDEVPKGEIELLCESMGVLVPPHDTVDDLLERWTYHLDRPTP